MRVIGVLCNTVLCALVCAIPTFTRSLPPGYEPISGARAAHPKESSIEEPPADEQDRARISTTIGNWLFPNQALPLSRYTALAALTRNGGLIRFGFGNVTPRQPRLADLFHVDPLPQLNDVVASYRTTGVRRTSILQSSSPSQGTPPIGDAANLANHLLGTQKFGLGPTFLILKQQGWTYGVLLNHLWSVAGPDNRADVNSTFIQPFLSYTTWTAWTFNINTEASSDWTAEEWSIPIHSQISKLLRFGTQPVSFAAGPRCWADSPTGGPRRCGFRGAVTSLFPLVVPTKTMNRSYGFGRRRR
jgi:hypothetical protein